MGEGGLGEGWAKFRMCEPKGKGFAMLSSHQILLCMELHSACKAYPVLERTPVKHKLFSQVIMQAACLH